MLQPNGNSVLMPVDLPVDAWRQQFRSLSVRENHVRKSLGLRRDMPLLERLKVYSSLWEAIDVGSDSRSKILLGRLYSHRKRLAQSKRLFAFLSSKMGVPISGPVTFPIRIRNHDLQIRLDLDNHGDHPSFFEVFIEFKHSAILPVWQPELVIDAGAHVGFFSLLARTYYPNTSIHAFEPSPRNAAVLKWHSEMNRAAIQLHPAAVWSTSADLEFLDSEKSNSGRTVVKTDRKAATLLSRAFLWWPNFPKSAHTVASSRWISRAQNLRFCLLYYHSCIRPQSFSWNCTIRKKQGPNSKRSLEKIFGPVICLKTMVSIRIGLYPIPRKSKP